MIVVSNVDELIDAGCGVVDMARGFPTKWGYLVDAECETCDGSSGVILGSEPDKQWSTRTVCPDCHDGKPWVTLGTKRRLSANEVSADPAARASGFRVLPIVDLHDFLETFNGGQFALFAERIEEL